MSIATIARPASTTLIVRDHEGALQVLMLQRSLSASFMPGAHVFPGGAVDAADGSDAVQACCDEASAEAAARLRIGEGALAHAVAALRECFEECGLWLGATAAPQRRLDLMALATARQRLHDGIDLATICNELGLQLATRSLSPWSHWVTPIDVAKRFDTRFFVALAPAGQEPAADERETTTKVWVNPGDALSRHARGDLPMEFATINTLESLLPFGTATALLDHARRPREIVAIHPRVARTAAGERRVLLPGDADYAEVMRLDPEGTGQAICLPAAAPRPSTPTGALRVGTSEAAT